MTGCLAIEQLASPASLTAAEREHVEGCPRCASLRAEYAAFAAGEGEGVAQADLAGAERALGALLERELGGAPAPARRATADVARARSPWWSGMPGRLALAAAGVLVVAGTFAVLRERPREVPRLRGATSAPLGVEATASDHALQLSWGARPDADGYRVEIVSPELQTLATFGPMREPVFTLTHGAVTSVPPGSDAYCRIVALRAGATIGESQPLAIKLP